MGFFGSLWSGVKAIGSGIKKAARWVGEKLGLVEKEIAESKPVTENSSAREIDRMQDILQSYSRTYKRRATEIEDTCIDLVDKYFTYLLNESFEKRNENIQRSIGLNNLERNQRKLRREIEGTITDTVARRISLDDNECRRIIALQQSDAKSIRVSDIIQRGGTFLGTARCPEFKQEETRAVAAQILKSHGIEGLVIIGGDGSLTGGSLLSKYGIPFLCLRTIDNDVWGSDYTIGADTALNTILDAINKLRDTASAHRRIVVLEVMGRTCGWLAMMAAIAGGAEYVLVPEVKFDLDKMCAELKESYENGRRYSIVVVAEGVGSAVDIGKVIGEKRVSILALQCSAMYSAAVRRQLKTA